jgi:hypothetical protein
MIEIFLRGVGETAWDVISRTEEYSYKNHTKPYDILNKFLGILWVFEIGPHAISHCWGLPLLPKAPHPKKFEGVKKRY